MKYRALLILKSIHTCLTKHLIDQFTINMTKGVSTLNVYQCNCLYKPNSKYKVWWAKPNKFRLSYNFIYGEIYDIEFIKKVANIFPSEKFKNSIFQNTIISGEDIHKAIYQLKVKYQLSNDIVEEKQTKKEQKFYNLFLLALNFNLLRCIIVEF